MEPLISARAFVLWALLEGESYGLELLDRLKQGGAAVGPGTLYPTLRRMEEEGLLTAREQQGPESRGGRPRVYYRLTAEGKRLALATGRVVRAWSPA